MNRSDTGRGVVGILTLGVALFLLLSLVSYDPTDIGGYTAGKDGPANVCGIVGAHCAWWLIAPFGRLTAYVFVLLVGGCGTYVLLYGRPRELWVKALGAAFLLPTLSTFMYLLFGSYTGQPNLVGRILGERVGQPFGAGAYMVFGMGALVSFLLATEMLPYRLSRLLFLWLLHRWYAWADQRPAIDEETGLSEAEQRALTSAELKAQHRREREERKRARAEERRAAREAAEDKDKARTEAEASVAKAPEAAGEKAAEPVPAAAEEEAEPRGEAKVKKPRRPRKPAGPPVTLGAGTSNKVPTQTNYTLPPIDLLERVIEKDKGEDEEQIRKEAAVLERTLDDFGIEAEVVEIDSGPVITQFEIELAPGIKIGKVQSLADDIARALGAGGVRVVAPIPGKTTIGIEVPNAERQHVRMRQVIETGVLERKRMSIPLLLGKDSSGAPLVADLAQMPHLLIAGATGSGKSVCVNSLIVSMMMTQYPDNLKLVLVDPKMVELACFENIPHLLCPVVTDMKRAAAVLEWACIQMDERYELLSKMGVRNITAYNKLSEQDIRDRLHAEPDAELDDIPFHMPYIALFIDEFADLMMSSGKDVEASITRLAQKSRAVGVHIVMATQRPSVDVITGLIKANLPCRMAFHCSTKVDSRTILDRNGAEALLGQGDMLFLPPGTSKLVRAQGTYLTDEEIKTVVDYVKGQSQPQFHQELVQQRPPGADGAPQARDEFYNEAVRIVVESQRGSVSLLQRKLGIGYSRAARLIDMMAEQGIVGAYKGSQAREVFLQPGDWAPAAGERGLGEFAEDDEEEEETGPEAGDDAPREDA